MYELVSCSQTAFARRELLYAAGFLVTRVWKVILDLPVLGGLHKPCIGIIPEPFPPGESGPAIYIYLLLM